MVQLGWQQQNEGHLDIVILGRDFDFDGEVLVRRSEQPSNARHSLPAGMPAALTAAFCGGEHQAEPVVWIRRKAGVTDVRTLNDASTRLVPSVTDR